MSEGVTVSATELQNKIYSTPNLGFALAMAAGPDGITSLHNGEISFERAEEFDSEAIIYLYTFDSDSVPSGKIEHIDEQQYALDVDEIIPESITQYKAKDVFEHYHLVDFVPMQGRM